MTWLCERHKRLARDGGVCVDCQNEVADMIEKKEAAPSSPSTQDADLIAEIEAFLNDSQKYLTSENRTAVVVQCYNHCLTAIRLLKSRQPHVTLTADDALFVHKVAQYISDSGKPIWAAELLTLADRLCLTKTEAPARDDISHNAPPQMNHLEAAQWAAKLLEYSASEEEAQVEGSPTRAGTFRRAAAHLRNYYVPVQTKAESE